MFASARILVLCSVVIFSTGSEYLAAQSNPDLTALKARAEQGDAAAQDSLATAYRMGTSGPKDYVEAMKWYRAAAQKGFGQAMFNLGTLYYNGEVVTPSNATHAYAWFLLAAAAGESAAQQAVSRTESEMPPGEREAGRLLMTTMLREGKEVPVDKARAVSILRQLADSGSGKAQVRVASMFILGREAPQDRGTAEQYCKSAAGHNYPPGMVCLGYLYETEATPRYKDAFAWYRKAAQARNPLGFYGMGEMYADGLGLSADAYKAAISFAIAAPTLEVAREALEEVEKRLTEKQRKNLQKSTELRTGLQQQMPFEMILEQTTDFALVLRLGALPK